MSGPLHLLRPFTRWRWRIDGNWMPITMVEVAELYVEKIAGLGFGEFTTATTRFPRRHEEMKGGSIYFCKSGVALFRMPFIRAEEHGENAEEFQGRHVIVMEPKLIRVQSIPRVGMVRGWRYLEDKDKPADIPKASEGDHLPERLREHMREAGIGL